MVKLYHQHSRELALYRDRFELDLLAAVLGHPVEATIELEDIDFSLDIFQREDLRLMCLACRITGDRPRDEILSFVKLAMKTNGFWDDTQQSESESSLWSNASFDRFADRFSKVESPLCKIEAMIKASRLSLLHAKERECREHMNHAVKTLEEAIQLCSRWT